MFCSNSFLWIMDSPCLLSTICEYTTNKIFLNYKFIKTNQRHNSEQLKNQLFCLANYIDENDKQNSAYCGTWFVVELFCIPIFFFPPFRSQANWNQSWMIVLTNLSVLLSFMRWLLWIASENRFCQVLVKIVSLIKCI